MQALKKLGNRLISSSPVKSATSTQSPLLVLQQHWKALNVEPDRKDVHVTDTDWPRRLKIIQDLLVSESLHNVDDNVCMEFFLRNDILMTLLKHVEQNVPVGIISVVVDFCKTLVSDLEYPILENARVLEVLFKLLHHGLAKSAGQASLENSLVDLMLHMSDKLQAKPALIALFFYDRGHDESSPLRSIDLARPPSERSNASPRVDALQGDQGDFPLFVNLMRFISHPGRNGNTARAAMMLCVQASSAAKTSQIDAYLISKLMFPSSVASILASFYDELSRVSITDNTELDTNEVWNNFIQLFKLCQSMMENGSPTMAAALAQCIEDQFCEKMLHARMAHKDERVALSTTTHLVLMLQCVNSTWLSRELCVFLLGDPSTMLDHSQKDLFVRGKDERESLKPILMERLARGSDSDLSWATWRLIYTLLTTQVVEAVPLLLGSAIARRMSEFGPNVLISNNLCAHFSLLMPFDDDIGVRYEEYYTDAERQFRANYTRYKQSLTVPHRGRQGSPNEPRTPAAADGTEEVFLQCLYEHLLEWVDNDHEYNLCISGIVVALALHPNPAVFYALFATDEFAGNLPSLFTVLEEVKREVMAQPSDPLSEHVARKVMGFETELDGPAEAADPLGAAATEEEEANVDPRLRNVLLFSECVKELIAAIQAQGVLGDARFDYYSTAQLDIIDDAAVNGGQQQKQEPKKEEAEESIDIQEEVDPLNSLG